VALIDDAEQRVVLRPGMTIIEPTGGNAGAALADVAAVRGYPLVVTMPEVMSVKRVALLRQLGAQVVQRCRLGAGATASLSARVRTHR
jgi:cysteine synthase A